MMTNVRTDVLRCRACTTALTRPVKHLSGLPVREYADKDEIQRKPTVVVGYWAVDPDPVGRHSSNEPADTPGCLVTNPADGVEPEVHPYGRRNSGCCGHDGCDGPNRRCPHCHHEVATLRDDCWMVAELRFESSAVEARPLV